MTCNHCTQRGASVQSASARGTRPHQLCLNKGRQTDDRDPSRHRPNRLQSPSTPRERKNSTARIHQRRFQGFECEPSTLVSSSAEIKDDSVWQSVIAPTSSSNDIDDAFHFGQIKGRHRTTEHVSRKFSRMPTCSMVTQLSGAAHRCSDPVSTAGANMATDKLLSANACGECPHETITNTATLTGNLKNISAENELDPGHLPGSRTFRCGAMPVPSVKART